MQPAGEGHKIGETTNDYVQAVAIDARTSSQIGAAIKNTGSANMMLKVTSKLNFAGSIEFVELEDYVLVPGAMIRHNELRPVSQVIMYVKSESNDVPTDYAIEFTVRYV